MVKILFFERNNICAREDPGLVRPAFFERYSPDGDMIGLQPGLPELPGRKPEELLLQLLKEQSFLLVCHFCIKKQSRPLVIDLGLAFWDEAEVPQVYRVEEDLRDRIRHIDVIDGISGLAFWD